MHLKRLNIYFLLFILNLIDIITSGSVIFTNKLNHKPKTNIEDMSSVLFFITLIFSQLAYNSFTGLEVAMCSTTIVEASNVMSAIFVQLMEENDEESAFVNALFIVSVSTLVFGAHSFLTLFIKVDYYVRMIPLELINGILAGAGVTMIFLGKCLFATDNKILTNFYFIFVIFIVFLIFLVEKNFPSLSFVAPLFALFFTFSFHLLKIKFYSELQNFGIILVKSDIKRSIFSLINLNFRSINYRNIIKFLPNIISLSFYCLLFLPFNLIVYSKITRQNVSLERELKTQGICNMIGSLFCLPTYFVCSYSITFYESSFATRNNSFFITLIYLLIFFIADFVRSNVPMQILSIFPIMVGFSLCFPAFYLPHDARTVYEFVFTWTIALLIGFSYSIHIVFFLGMAISIISYYLTIKFLKIANNFDPNLFKEVKNADYLLIDYPLFFINVNRFLYELTNINSNKVIIDLYKCIAFDMLGNEIFLSHFDDNKIYFVIGKPYFAKLCEWNKLRNVHLFDNHEKALLLLKNL